jgi:spore germination protein KB
VDEKNNRISPFQFASIGALLGNSLFSGIGISTLLNLAKQDSWMTVIIGFIIGLIPILLLIYIINYKPEKNIFEKNKIIFGKILGSIINLILSLYAFIILLIVIGSSINISETMYLTKTPVFIVAALFVIPAIYAVINGMETIARLSEILFFLAILVVSIIVVSLFYTAGSITEIIDQLKPMFINGPIPVIKNSLVFIGFSLTPWFMLLIIPKNNIINNKKYSYYLIGGYFICSLLMFFVFTLIPGVVTINLAELYRFPAYYVQRKINIGGVLNNVENF